MKTPGHCFSLMHIMHRSCPALALCAAVVATLLGPTKVSSQEAAKGSVATGEEAIRSATAAYREAVENGDVDAVAKFWTPDADYVDHAGHAFKIQAALAAARNRAQTAGRIARPPLKIETLAVRLLSPDVAVEDGILERAVAAGDEPAKSRYCAVWVKRDGKWLIDGVRESAYSPVTSSNHFEGLDWLVGDWSAEGPQSTAEATYIWGPKKSYLLRQLKLTPKGAEPITATQWIGWDPVHEHIRSFEFDSQGGFRDGVWKRDSDDAWIVSSTTVAADGHVGTATSVYSRIDDNTATWELVDEEMDGDQGSEIQMRATRKPRSK